ncbi:antibiotic biosynthesis monooxygenase [Zhongshania sp.]|uniref:antibiotic biosynthesis monooxygenase family protein n=1 Tax=Zhongshania sp. TaxID=1971902 RepID=UPI003567F0B4
MIIERAEISLKEGSEGAFAGAMKSRGSALLAAAAGCHSVKVGRGVESPSKFILVLEWDSVEAHISFTKTPGYAAFIELIGAFVESVDMQHFDIG